MKLFVHMKAQPIESMTISGTHVKRERSGDPTHFLPCFPTREAAIAWVGRDDGLIMEAEQIEEPK